MRSSATSCWGLGVFGARRLFEGRTEGVEKTLKEGLKSKSTSTLCSWQEGIEVGTYDVLSSKKRSDGKEHLNWGTRTLWPEGFWNESSNLALNFGLSAMEGGDFLTREGLDLIGATAFIERPKRAARVALLLEVVDLATQMEISFDKLGVPGFDFDAERTFGGSGKNEEEMTVDVFNKNSERLGFNWRNLRIFNISYIIRLKSSWREVSRAQDYNLFHTQSFSAQISNAKEQRSRIQRIEISLESWKYSCNDEELWRYSEGRA